jgi:calcineurin-like phosphoesterase family protein
MKREKQIWFTSDSHYFHGNIIRFSNRPFKDADHMTEELVKSWNEVVDVNDDVYHLGDVSLGNVNKTENVLFRLNGNIHLIKGNHEKSTLQTAVNRSRFTWIKDYHEMSVVMPDGTKQFIVLCHYAMRVWNKSHHGAWQLYGHSHDSMEHEAWGRSMDVGVDSAYRILGEYRPFNLHEIAKIMSKRGHNPVDHHLESKL